MRKSIVIAGSMAQRPGRGGHTWVFLQYLLGFRKAGWDVVFLDRLEPEMCRDTSGHQVRVEDSWNLRYFHDVMGRFGFRDDSAVVFNDRTATFGLSLSLIHISEPTRLLSISYAVFCLKK